MVAPRYEATRRRLRPGAASSATRCCAAACGDPTHRRTLDVFDEQLARAGSELVRGRLRLLERLVPAVERAYAELAGSMPERERARRRPSTPRTSPRGPTCRSSPDDDIDVVLRAALESRRRAEIDRGTTLVGPHRDEWRLRLGGLESRTHASQGEQRTLALALRLGGHQLCTEITGTAPVLLLDDVFSELDETRSSALIAHLTAGQTLITTAGRVPDGVHADRVFHVEAGRVAAGSVPERDRRACDAMTRPRRPERRRPGPDRGRARGGARRARDARRRRARRRSSSAGRRSSGTTSRRTRGPSGARRRALGRRRQPPVGDAVALPRGGPDRARERGRRRATRCTRSRSRVRPESGAK